MEQQHPGFTSTYYIVTLTTLFRSSTRSRQGTEWRNRERTYNAYSHQRPDGRVRRRQRPRHHAAPRRRDDPRQGAGLSRVRTIVGLLSQAQGPPPLRSEEHTSELQSLMRISYAVFCLKKKKKQPYQNTIMKKHTTA